MTETNIDMGRVLLGKGGKLRALAVTSAKRISQLSDVPTLAESGYHNFEYQVFYGVLPPAETPRDRVARLNAAIERAPRHAGPARKTREHRRRRTSEFAGAGRKVPRK